MLTCYGIPPLPSTPGGRSWWAKTYSASVYIPVEPGGLISTTVRMQTLNQIGSSNWSGYSADIRDKGNSSNTGVGFVSATFNVPHVTQLSPDQPVAAWVGMGGDDSTAKELWQAGVVCFSQGGTACAAIYEDYCPPLPQSQCLNSGYSVQLSQSQYPVYSGDTFSPAVRWDGTYWFTDVQQNWHTTATPGIWGKGAELVDSANWILEEATPGGRSGPAIDDTTDPVTFQNADSQGAAYQNLNSWPTLRRWTLYDCYYTNLVDALPNVPYPGDQFTVQVSQSSGHTCP